MRALPVPNLPPATRRRPQPIQQEAQVSILVLNCGSSSIKFAVIDPADDSVLRAGVAEGIGEASGRFRHWSPIDDQRESRAVRLDSHAAALDLVWGGIDREEISAIGHRVVHGGHQFRQACRVQDSVLATLAELDPLAPLHNPVNRLGIERSLARFPGIPQVAVFDTAFHATLPEYAHRYAIPDHWSRDFGVRRYGFHGISHQYLADATARFLGKSPADTNLVSLHLGNGASAAAIRAGVCVDTSMGMTPLEGLIMGTRGGDIDPGALLYLLRSGVPLEQLDQQLNQHSGLQAICGHNDMREVLRLQGAGDRRAELAMEMFCYRVRKYIGAYFAVLDRVDAMVFAAGVGENSPQVREQVCRGLGALGLSIDPALNDNPAQGMRAIHSGDSSVPVLIIPTDEELQIAREVQAVLNR